MASSGSPEGERLLPTDPLHLPLLPLDTHGDALEPQQQWWRRLFSAATACCRSGELARLLPTDPLHPPLLPQDALQLPPLLQDTHGDALQPQQQWWRRLFSAAAAFWRSVIPLSRCCSFSNLGFAGFLEAVASLAVMAILTLNIYSASYFLAWAKPDSVCLDLKNPKFSKTFKVVLKIIIVSLPFAFCPVTLYISGNVKALQQERRGMGYAAGLVILEIIFVFILGALMTVCMSEASVPKVIGVTIGIVIFVFLVWGCLCHHPKWLRSFMFPSCCCPERDVEAAVPLGQEMLN